MQAALYVREKQKQRRKKLRRGRIELPSNVATKEIAPFPRYPPVRWCSQGKAAWQERDRERRVSLTEVAVNHRIKATEAHRRWMKRNRIHDSSFGGSSSDEDIPGLYGHQSEAANALLYVGLGTVAIGLVISFVGTGEKGFKTLELRLIGPSLIGSGLLCCLIRIFLCVCPSRCLRRRHKHRHRHKKESVNRHSGPHHQHHHSFFNSGNKGTVNATEDIALADQTSLLMKNNKKTVSILTSPANQPSGSSTNNQHQKYEHLPPTDIVASTTLFLQHERERASSAYNSYQVPAINIPNFVANNSDDEGSHHHRRPPKQSEGNLLDLELQQLDGSSFDICSFDSSNSQDKSAILNENDSESSKTVKSASRREKVNRPRAPANATTPTSRTGLVNPDPEAHKLEEDMLLADEIAAEMDSHSFNKDMPCSSKSVRSITRQVAASSPQHSEKVDLLQNEIVLSPAKLQQDIRDQ
ncbi:uncharacterized protein [Anabrus simplex]|uniref:uncharacterized protein n=1 Tax=Anabrus simplex TaxID=316456 RepID=UPI0034DCC66B